MTKDQVESGHMANTMEELKELGKQMEQMKEDQGDKRKSEPVQFDEEKGPQK